MICTMRNAALSLLLSVTLSGCGALSALDEASQPLEIYELRTPPVQAASSRRSVELVVEEPVASGALAVERIMIRPSPLQAQYLPGIRWADTAPVMIQTLLVRGLSETGALASVGRRPVGTVADYAVLSELTDFQAETQNAAEAVHVRARLVVRLVRERDTRVIATRAFDSSATAISAESDAIAAAFDWATSTLLSEAIGWIVTRTR